MRTRLRDCPDARQPASAYGRAMGPVPRSSVLCAVATTAFAACAGVAGAAGWSTPAVLEARCVKDAVNCRSETSPRVALNARGQSVVAWVAKNRIRAAIGDARGRFGRSLAFEKAFRPAVTMAANGTAVVVWSAGGQLRYVRRAPGHGFSRPANLVPGSKEGDDMPKTAIQPDGSTLVLYENTTRTAAGYVTELRSVRIRPGRRPTNPLVLGRGWVDRDGFGASDGHATACCLGVRGSIFIPAPPRTVLAWSPAAGWAILAPALATREVVESVGQGHGEVVLGTVAVLHSGDAGTSGLPALLRAGAGGVFGAPLAAPVKRAGLAFGPVVAIDGSGRSALVYQEKTAPKAFSRDAPVWVVTAPRGGAFGARQALDRGLARFPQLRPYRSGAIVAWEAPKHRWGVAVERNGRFASGPAPSGGPSAAGEDSIRSRDLATAGRYAALAWTASDGSVRVSLAASL